MWICYIYIYIHIKCDRCNISNLKFNISYIYIDIYMFILHIYIYIYNLNIKNSYWKISSHIETLPPKNITILRGFQENRLKESFVSLNTRGLWFLSKTKGLRISIKDHQMVSGNIIIACSMPVHISRNQMWYISASDRERERSPSNIMKRKVRWTSSSKSARKNNGRIATMGICRDLFLGLNFVFGPFLQNYGPA